VFELVVAYFLFIKTKGSSLEEISLKIEGVQMQDELAETANTIPIDEKRAADDTINVDSVERV